MRQAALIGILKDLPRFDEVRLPITIEGYRFGLKVR